jgi:hypothetical protein
VKGTGWTFSVTSLITGESRVTTFDSFDITAGCDALVICDAIGLQKMLPSFLDAFRGFLSIFSVHQRILDVGL